ncbi:MAG: class I SAM-dependent methyltransferase [Candidatus Omnitrophota bacterium]
MPTTNKPIGKFVRREDCRFCQGKDLTQILDLGNVPLAGGFLKEKDFPDEKFFPLRLNFCKDCYLVQVSDMVSADVLFKNNYFFFSSAIGTLIQHFKDFALETHDRFLKGIDKPSILEIGCNDGVLLRPFSALGVKALGVDPATNVVQRIDPKDAIVVNDYFTEKVAAGIKEKHGQVDAIVSSFSFAHIDDMVDVMKGIKCLLKDKGVFIFEIYYLGTLMDEMQYDMIYQEHMSYYSLITLKKFLNRFGMEVFDVKYIPGVRSGSVRFYARNIGKRDDRISSAVVDMIEQEHEKGFDREDAYLDYAEKVKNTRVQLVSLLDRLKKEGKRIIGYGASGRGTIIMNNCGIDGRYLDYVVDDAPAKHGFYTPGTHVVIKPWDFVEKSEFPDYAVLFAWAFTDEVLKKREDYIKKGGKFIIPLPRVRIYPE